jgi:hypothetical protein
MTSPKAASTPAVAEGLHSDAASRVAGVIFGTGVSTPLAKAGSGDHE